MKLYSKFAILTFSLAMAIMLPAIAQNPVKAPSRGKESTSTTSSSNSKSGNKGKSKKGSGSTGSTSVKSKKGSNPDSSAKSSTPKPTSSSQGSSRPSTFSNGLNQWTSFTLEPHEVINDAEYRSNLKINGYKSLLVTADTISGQQSLIVNGRRVVNRNLHQVFFVHENTLDDLVYTYGNNGAEYIVIQGKTYGPYEQVGEVWDNNGFWNYYSHQIGSKFHEFIFKQMGKFYRHDVDGTIELISNLYNDTYQMGFSHKTYRSPNGQHKIQVSADGRSVTVGGKTVQLVPSGVSEKDIFYHALNCYDDGHACIKVTYRTSPTNLEDVRAVIRNGQVTYGTNNQTFDYRKGVLQSSDTPPSPYEYDYILSYKKGYTPIKPGSNWGQDMYDFTLQDSAKQHTFMANWAYDYVIIDGQRITSHSPIDAWYDAAEHAFAWTTIDGRNIKQYVYKL